ncbi:TetR/AcrR family transcriptional regulator [Mycolicibacterium sp. P9-64]|uniref:TetR/AcrR family transcriptional regulator n=1 Tax=Mycolicibacterium sp. P9-64 TaxID=2024612 RepID=UPI001564EC23|nr:TetR/AcrR family transcriptional regulator [Mycolicibacterium sp. P9-64]
MTTQPKDRDGRATRWEHRRPTLLAAATEYVLDNGVANLTLRPLAAGIGVTIATVVRQFGSKEQLIEEVTRGINREIVENLHDDPELAAGPPVQTLRLLWRRWLTPAEARKFALMFELYGLALRDPEKYRWFTDSVVRDWGLALIEDALIDSGIESGQAEIVGTLTLALLRGLQLDHAATHDTARIDAAFEMAVALLAPTVGPPEPTPTY